MHSATCEISIAAPVYQSRQAQSVPLERSNINPSSSVTVKVPSRLIGFVSVIQQHTPGPIRTCRDA